MNLLKLDSFDENKPSILVEYSVGFRSTSFNTVLSYFHEFLREYDQYNIILLGNGKGKKYYLKYAEELEVFDGVLHIPLLKDFKTWMEFKTWLQGYYDANDKLLKSLNIRWVVFMMGLLKTGMKSIEMKGIRSILDTNAGIGWMSTQSSVSAWMNALFLTKHLGVRAFQLLADPLEIDPSRVEWLQPIDITCLFGYEKNNYNEGMSFKKFNHVEYYYKYVYRYPNLDKNNLFTWAYYVISKDRWNIMFNKKNPWGWELHKYVDKIEEKQVFVYNKYSKPVIDNRISKEEYFAWLERSQFTLIMPACMEENFTYMRFLDAVARRCTPFILDNIKPYVLRDYFCDEEDWKMIQPLIVSMEELPEKIKTFSTAYGQKLFDHFIGNRELNVDFERI